jgi:hypothetical protein
VVLDAQGFWVSNLWVPVMFESRPVGQVVLVLRCEIISELLSGWDTPFGYFLRVLGPPRRCACQVIRGFAGPLAFGFAARLLCFVIRWGLVIGYYFRKREVRDDAQIESDEGLVDVCLHTVAGRLPLACWIACRLRWKEPSLETKFWKTQSSMYTNFM